MPKAKGKNLKSENPGATNPSTDSRDVEQSPFTLSKEGSILVRIHAKPGAKQNAVTDISLDCVSVQIAAAAKEGEANEELVKYMAFVLALKKSSVTLERGAKSREKTIKIESSNLTLKDVKDLIQKASDA